MSRKPLLGKWAGHEDLALHWNADVTREQTSFETPIGWPSAAERASDVFAEQPMVDQAQSGEPMPTRQMDRCAVGALWIQSDVGLHEVQLGNGDGLLRYGAELVGQTDCKFASNANV